MIEEGIGHVSAGSCGQAEGVGVARIRVHSDAVQAEFRGHFDEAFSQRLSRKIVLRGIKPVHQRKTVCPRRGHGKPQNAPEIIRFGFVSASGD
jgi:hypothetical protein